MGKQKNDRYTQQEVEEIVSSYNKNMVLVSKYNGSKKQIRVKCLICGKETDRVFIVYKKSSECPCCRTARKIEEFKDKIEKKFKERNKEKLFKLQRVDRDGSGTYRIYFYCTTHRRDESILWSNFAKNKIIECSDCFICRMAQNRMLKNHEFFIKNGYSPVQLRKFRLSNEKKYMY